jgi:hypothetical protein
MTSPIRLLPLLTAVTLAGTFPVSAQQAASHAEGAATIGSVRASAFAIIVGNAVNTINNALPDSMVRLRDARYGRIVGSTLTNSVGAYSFTHLDPGNYIVELLTVGDSFRGLDPGNSTLEIAKQTPLAATNLISVNAGQTAHTIVRLPFKPTFLAVLPKAVLQGVAAVVPSGIPMSER